MEAAIYITVAVGIAFVVMAIVSVIQAVMAPLSKCQKCHMQNWQRYGDKEDTCCRFCGYYQRTGKM